MRYLVTGGAGFIGSHLVESLVARGDEVIVLDNLSTGKLDNIAHVRPHIDLVPGSVIDALLVDELVERADVVVHLAAAVGVRLIVENPLRSLLTNIRGAETILEAAHRYGRKTLVASSSEIYGKNVQGPFSEDDDRILGSNKISRWAYSTSKAVDEMLAFAYYRERNVPTIVVRLFNTVGPRQTGAYGMVLPRFVAQALAGAPLTVFGDGQQTRCFCHVEDAVAAMLGLLDEDASHGDVFNVGSIEEVTIHELAERVIKATDSSSEVTLIPYEKAYEEGFEDMLRRVPDITKINELIGWQPQRDLDSIVGELVSEARTQADDWFGATSRVVARRDER